jgi:hypothetical protein
MAGKHISTVTDKHAPAQPVSVPSLGNSRLTRQAVVEELMETVFPVWSVPRLYKKDQQDNVEYRRVRWHTTDYDHAKWQTILSS